MNTDPERVREAMRELAAAQRDIARARPRGGILAIRIGPDGNWTWVSAWRLVPVVVCFAAFVGIGALIVAGLDVVVSPIPEDGTFGMVVVRYYPSSLSWLAAVPCFLIGFGVTAGVVLHIGELSGLKVVFWIGLATVVTSLGDMFVHRAVWPTPAVVIQTDGIDCWRDAVRRFSLRWSDVAGMQRDGLVRDAGVSFLLRPGAAAQLGQQRPRCQLASLSGSPDEIMREMQSAWQRGR